VTSTGTFPDEGKAGGHLVVEVLEAVDMILIFPRPIIRPLFVNIPLILLGQIPAKPAGVPSQ